MTRSRLAASGLLALVFALGALVGGAATMLADRTRHGGDRSGDRPSFVRILKEELTLTADQEQRISGILDRHQPAMDSIWGIVRPQFEAERQTVRNEIRALLEPDQLKKYEVLIARRDSVRRARGGLHGGR
jgi:Spy/CpxP family protein refolding chaperone